MTQLICSRLRPAGVSAYPIKITDKKQIPNFAIAMHIYFLMLADSILNGIKASAEPIKKVCSAEFRGSNAIAARRRRR